MIAAIGLDLSTRATGLALPDGTCRTLRPKADTQQGRLIEVVERLGARLHGGNKPALAVIEGTFSNPKFVTAGMKLAELGGAIRLMLYSRRIPYLEIGPTSLKLFATNNGHASKDEMIAAARALGATVANDNEADAWFLWLAAQQRYEPTLDRPQLTQVLHALAWPELSVSAA